MINTKEEEMVMTPRGQFVVFEGLDGTGKSTQVEMLVAQKNTRGDRPAIATCEPSPLTEPGKLVRKILSGGKKTYADDVYGMFHLFCADRAQHVEMTIEPKLLAGNDVVCDRYTLSTIMYQGANNFILDKEPSKYKTREFIEYMMNSMLPFIFPDILFILQVDGDDIDIILERLRKRNSQRSTRREFYETRNFLIATYHFFDIFGDKIRRWYQANGTKVVSIPAHWSPYETHSLVEYHCNSHSIW